MYLVSFSYNRQGENFTRYSTTLTINSPFKVWHGVKTAKQGPLDKPITNVQLLGWYELTEFEKEMAVKDKMSSNYPPGVTGNEPQITGEYSLEAALVSIRKALENIEHNDKTEYTYGKGKGARDRFGKLPEGVGKRFKTPAEIARQAIRDLNEIIDDL